MLRRLEGGVAKERADRRQAQIAAAYPVAALALQVLEKMPDQRGVEVLQTQIRGRLAQLILGIAQQQAEGIAVGGDGMGAGMALVQQPVREK